MVKHLISAKLNSEATPTAITTSVTATSTYEEVEHSTLSNATSESAIWK